MRTSIRSLLALSLLAVILAACGTTAAPTPQPTAPASDAPSPSTPAPEAPGTSPAVAGTITIVDGVSVGGPGMSVTDALASGNADPLLVNGTMFMDVDGNFYLAQSSTDASAPIFTEPLLGVVDYPFSAAEWDPANADLTGLQEVDGTQFFANKQLFGVVAS